MKKLLFEIVMNYPEIQLNFPEVEEYFREIEHTNSEVKKLPGPEECLCGV